MEVSAKLRLPKSGRVEAMVISWREVNYAMVQRGSFLLLLQRIHVRSNKLVLPFRSQECFETVGDAFDLLQMRFIRDGSKVKNATITWRHNAIGRNHTAVIFDGTREELA